MAATENLGALLAQAARRYSGREAISVPGAPEAMHFAEFLAAADSVRGALADGGLAADEPVHVRVSNHPLDLAAYLGVWLAAGVVVPLHRGSPRGCAS